MSDQKLLELAAKAAGMDPPFDGHGVFSAWVGTAENGHWWDPLSDDGDALRLAVQLDLLIYSYSAEQKCVAKWFAEGFAVEYWHWNQNQGAGPAMRRAIVRAAAEIGKATS
ncbi:hypothetical protein [Pseudomonas brassicacearum]|uniref:hypothetical protein n=1 Tax=Pseudomonas brassicacearum TaxID=930166 RepID=UPI000AFBA027|nr:hypothetical protein [Pseudomonas brassicacearum]